MKNKINQIASVPDEQINAILPLVSRALYKKEEYFSKAGDCPTHIGYIVNGLFRLFYIDIKGREYTKYFNTQNSLVVVYNSILIDQPSNLYIQALEDSEVLLINYKEWLNFAEPHICWQIFFRKFAEQAYLEKEKRESDLLCYDAETRYRNFQKDFPGLDKEIKQHHIASFLGMSPETLSRVKKRKNLYAPG